MAKYKTIYILVEDGRETGLLSGDGITGKICYSLKKACETLTKRVWYVEADRQGHDFGTRQLEFLQQRQYYL